jgi:hypothetical protein
MTQPKVYFQMKKMIKVCKRMRSAAKDKDYCDELIHELEVKCQELEILAIEELNSLEDIDDLNSLYND